MPAKKELLVLEATEAERGRVEGTTFGRARQQVGRWVRWRGAARTVAER